MQSIKFYHLMISRHDTEKKALRRIKSLTKAISVRGVLAISDLTGLSRWWQ